MLIRKKILFWFGVFTALAGLAVLTSLLAEPSKSGGFLGFSTGRWAALFFNLLILAGVFFFIYRLQKDQAGKLEAWFSNEQNLFNLFFLCIIIFGVSFPSALGKIPVIRHNEYFGRISPWLFWLSFSSGTFALILLVALRQSVLKWLRQFFPFNELALQTTTLTTFQYFSIRAGALLYIIFQWTGHLQVRAAKSLPDSIDYLFPASFAWNNPVLWTHTKPWGTAVLYKLTGDSPITIDAVQTILSTLAWLMLAWAFSKVMRSARLRIAVFAFILCFSLAPSVQMWNHVLQSESLSISLMISILGVWISLLRRWHWGKLFALILLFAWWIGARDTNIYLGLLIAAILILTGSVFRRHRYYWAVSVLLILLSLVNMQIAEMPTLPRWLYPLTNTVLHRILPNEEFMKYFKSNEMPVSTELLALSGGLAYSDNFAVFNSPALNDVEKWLFKYGKQVYVRFLLAHPLYTLISPWQNINDLLGTEGLTGYAPDNYNPILEWWFGGLYPNSLWLMLLLSLTGIAGSLWTKPWREQQRTFLLMTGFLTLFFPHFYLVWHGDADEVARHAIQASLQLRLSLWLLLFLSLDSFRKISK
jgi:hypothetical protein